MKIDFSNPEVWKSLESKAYHGTLEIEDFPPCEYKYFDQLRNIYYAFKFEGLNKSDAETCKKKILHQYQNEKYRYDNYFRCVADWNNNILKSEMLRSQISKSSDLVEKYQLAVQCIDVLTGDIVFQRTEIQKLENQKGEQS